MKVAMPMESDLGWGIAGMNLTREMSRMPTLEGVTLHCIPKHDFEPFCREAWNAVNIGYCFFEHEILAYHYLYAAAGKWDCIVAGSRWCEYHLRIAGVRQVTTILQGVDQDIFCRRPTRAADGRFIVFSGGKFEFRKGQDIVIAAMRNFMARHPDVWLACAWNNHWDASIQTMAQSELIRFEQGEMSGEELYRSVLDANGIDLNRVILHPRCDNHRMADLYAASDLGLFPNRCEGGNNMVMSEYMACGRPVVASSWSGHADVLTPENAFTLSPCRPVLACIQGHVTGVWFEPSVDAVVAALEEAYHDRAARQRKADQAACDMLKLSWQEASRRFHALGSHFSKRKERVVTESTLQQRFRLAEQAFDNAAYDDALSIYNQLLYEMPLDAELYNCIGTVLDRLGRYSEAEAYYRKSLALQPSMAVAQFNLANTLHRTAQTDEAIKSLIRLVESHPDFAEAWHNLGIIYFERKQFEPAASCLERVVRLRKDNYEAYASLARIYYQWGTNLPRAALCLQVVSAVLPPQVDRLNLEGLVHHELHQFDEAEQCYRQGLTLEPQNTVLLNNIGNLMLAQCKPEKAAWYFNCALQVEPQDGAIRFNRAVARLLMGDYRRGWQDYEARFDKLEPVVRRHVELPRWQGEPLNGKTLLVWAEQVYGDTIQFARYLPLLGQAGGRVVFECLDVTLAPLFIRMAGIDQLVVRGQQLPAVDLQVPLASLPGLLGTTLDTIPFPEGYLWPDQQRLHKWSATVAACVPTDQGALKVGLIWGGRKPRLNAGRSMTLQQFQPLWRLRDVCWFSLQTGEDREQLSETVPIVDLMDEVADFADTAALMKCVDLIISIDTAGAHLAGALGVPVWVMVKSYPDWRWLMERQDSPWYRSAKIFRQQLPEGWDHVVGLLTKELQQLLDSRKKTVKENSGH